MDINKIEISILNKNKSEINNVLDKYKVNNIHIDIMDGYFTNSLSNITPHFLKEINFENKNLHLHFMVNEIELFFNYFSSIDNIKYVSYHFENSIINNNYKKFNDYLSSKGIKVGLVLNPDTNIFDIKNIIDDFDFIQLMTVYPGKGGQHFILEMEKKIIEFKKIYNKKTLFIDGGVNNIVYNKLYNYVDKFVIGSYLFN